MPWISGEAEAMWRDAVSPKPSVRNPALNYWARNLNELPGPLCFTLDSADLLRGVWQRVVGKSEQRCMCGERRWFIPAYSQPFYAPDEPKLITLGAGRPQLAIAPWGGDVQATMVQLSVSDGYMVRRMMPYSHLTQAQLRAIGFGTLDGMEQVAENSVMGFFTSNLEDRTALNGIAEEFTGSPLAVKSGISLSGGLADVFLFASFAVYDVDTEAGTATVVVSRNCQQVNPAERSEMHICG